ncbi:MAG: exodeoxyribonuclease VII small subunit [Salinisphaera sp.]|nr:exodeoxyribonuclease VII small subunit [Salinisphaera sp.]
MPRARKTDTPAQPADDAPDLAQFESSVSELESLVESLESGDVSLENALARFERGVTLSRQCQALLKNAELRVDQLLADTNGGLQPAPFEQKPEPSD